MKYRFCVIVLTLTFVTACSGSPPAASATPTLTVTSPNQLLPTVIAARTPTPPPTDTPQSTPTNLPTQPTSTEQSVFGFIDIPWGVADAGNYFLYANAWLTLTWNNPPPNCVRYDFIVEGSDADRTVIGTDIDLSDGVSIDWQVPEQLSGSLLGEASCDDDQILYSNWSGELHSGPAPPEGVCTLASGTIGVLDLFSTPSLSSETSAYLIPGVFAAVLERTANGWYRIDESVAFDYETGEAPTGPGWVWAEHSIQLFGPCESVPIAD
jgi:hypothetical protein